MLPSNPVVVNIGAGAGTSGLALMESREDLYLITVDIQKEDSPFGCLVAEENILREAGLWNGRNRQIHGNSAYVGTEWLENHHDSQADMVFIDGDHSYEGCRDDILNWLPNIKPGGIIAVHDYKKETVFQRTDLPPNVPHYKAWPGVDAAVDEFLLDEYEVVLHTDTLIAFKVADNNA